MDTSIPVAGEQNGKPSGPHSWVVVLSSAGYYVGAMLGILLTFQHFPISFFWLSNAIMLAALLALPVHIWWLVLIAALPAHLAITVKSGVPIGMVLCWFISIACRRLLAPRRCAACSDDVYVCIFSGIWLYSLFSARLLHHSPRRYLNLCSSSFSVGVRDATGICGACAFSSISLGY